MISKQMILRNYQSLKNQIFISDLPKLLKFLRKNLKLTQAEMAEILNTSRFIVSHYENKKKLLTQSEAEYFFHKLGLPLEDINIFFKFYIKDKKNG